MQKIFPNSFFLIFLTIFLLNKVTLAKELIFKLDKVAEGIYYHRSILDEPNIRNQGLIANLGLIVGDENILVVDAGPSKILARKLIASIKNISNKPIRYLILTHRHFDHAFGIEAFKELNTIIYMSKKEFYYLKKDGPAIFNNLVKNRGFKNTGVNFNNIEENDINFLEDEKILDLGNRKVLIKNLGAAHTMGDIIIYDYKTKTYFVGDLLFKGRAAAFTDANLIEWRKKINFFSKEPWKIIIPGHGEVIKKKDDLNDTLLWLKFVQKSIERSLENGDMLSEVLQYDMPEKINHLELKTITLKEGLKRQFEIIK